MASIDADKIAIEIDRFSDDWTPQTLRDVFVIHGCAIVRNIIPLQRLSELNNLITQAYRNTAGVHVYDRDLVKFTNGKTSGFELADVPLLQGLLQEIYAGQDWRPDSVTARRIQGVDANHDWQRPLDLHLDSQYHGFRFTVNFWIPFQECGVAAPSLQLVPLNYLETRRYCKFTEDHPREGDKWFFGHFAEGALEPSVLQGEFGENCFLRPVMKPGDVIVSSNWVIHGSYQTPQMKNGRTSVEIRFIGDKLDIESNLWV